MRENKICFHEKSLIPKLWKSEKKIVSWKIIDSWIIEVKKKNQISWKIMGRKTNLPTYFQGNQRFIIREFLMKKKKKKNILGKS